MTNFLLIRHATTDAVGYRITGRKEGVGLNKDGHQQALQLVQRLQTVKIDAIFSSPLQRATQTAEPLSKHLHQPIETSESFNEIDMGSWTDSKLSSLQNNPDFRLFNTFRSHFRIPSGELMSEAQIRMVRGLHELTASHYGKTLVVVSHSDMIRASLVYYMGIPVDLLHRIEISPASISILQIFEETSRVLLLNHTGDIKM